MKQYRCKHAAEAQRWTDTDADREAFSAWFEAHDAVFETRGPIALLPSLQTRGSAATSYATHDVAAHSYDTHDVQPGEWVVFSDGEFIAMEDWQFHDMYEEAP
jgi:hypothetical protein